MISNELQDLCWKYHVFNYHSGSNHISFLNNKGMILRFRDGYRIKYPNVSHTLFNTLEEAAKYALDIIVNNMKGFKYV